MSLLSYRGGNRCLRTPSPQFPIVLPSVLLLTAPSLSPLAHNLVGIEPQGHRPAWGEARGRREWVVALTGRTRLGRAPFEGPSSPPPSFGPGVTSSCYHVPVAEGFHCPPPCRPPPGSPPALLHPSIPQSPITSPAPSSDTPCTGTPCKTTPPQHTRAPALASAFCN